jgi:GT2 family glycosyltransferase
VISLIVSIFNPPELTANFISWVAELLTDESFEVILISDGDVHRETRSLMRQARTNNRRFKILFRDESVGYGVANNQAVRHATGDILIFLDSDTFPKRGSIQILANYLRTHHDTGVAQGLLLYPQNIRVQSAGHIFGAFFNRHALMGRRANLAIVQKPMARQALTSAYYAVRRRDFIGAGGFDEFYLNSHEGMEFALKMHLAGRRCDYRPEAVAYHVQGGARRHVVVDERQPIARFWTLWGSKIIRDLDHLLAAQLTTQQRRRKFLRITASSNRAWSETLAFLDITADEIATIPPAECRMALQETLVPEIRRSKSPILFATDHFSNIAENRLWFQSRPHQNDLILDCHGNVVTISEILS